jgi:methionyl-tRNA formyltransferase
VSSRILLIGLGPTTRTALDSLVEVFELVGMVRDADDETAARARSLGIPLYTDTSLKAIERLVADLTPDCVVVSSFNRILPARLIARSRFVNVHYAPLPQYRGRANVNWAIINGEPLAGISIHSILPELDAGNILFQETVPLHESDTVSDLYERLNSIQLSTLGKTVRGFLEGDIGQPQDERQATYGCTRLPEDGEIDWSASTRSIDRLVRALTPPFPGAYTYLNCERLRVWKARPVSEPPTYVGRVPGRVIGRSSRDGFADVLTGDGVLRIFEMQTDTDERVPAAHLITSVHSTLGLSARDLLARIRELEQQLADAHRDQAATEIRSLVALS